MEKKCSTCKELKSFDQFRKDSSRKDGMHPVCNFCNSEAQRKWYQNNKNKARDNANKNYHENKDEINTKRKEEKKWMEPEARAKRKEEYENNKDKHRERSWKRAGMKDMTVFRYNLMFTQQDGCCAICKKHQFEFKRLFCVDHNHDTGEVRALLCDSCNRGLGYFKDSSALLQEGFNYLLKYTEYGTNALGNGL